MLHGARARDGGETDGAMAVASAQNDMATLALAAVLPNTFGAQKTLVILVNFQDKQTQPYTPDTARNVVFNTTSNFDLENSFPADLAHGLRLRLVYDAARQHGLRLQPDRNPCQPGRHRNRGQSL
jgi:hypothetical protein